MVDPIPRTLRPSSHSNALRLFFANDFLSRKEIANIMNITPAAVTPIINDLYSKGIIKNAENDGHTPNSVGRRQNLFSINAESRYVLCVDIYPDYIYYGITNLRGKTSYQERQINIIEKTSLEWVQKIAYHCLDIIKISATPANQLLGIGITIVGPVNHIEGIALHPFNMYDSQIPIREYFERFVPFPVAVESNVCASLRSELLYRTSIGNSHNIIMLKWGPGIGSALAINGVNYKGYNYQSSEIGHNIFSSRTGKKCRCGRYGCLETLISEDAVIEHISELINNHRDLASLAKKLGSPSKDNIKYFLQDPPAILQNYMVECIKKLALTTNNAIILLSPEKVVLFGKFFIHDWIYSCFVKAIYDKNPLLNKNLFIRLQYAENHSFMGATTIAIENSLLKDRESGI